jgi:hypothetical protein
MHVLRHTGVVSTWQIFATPQSNINVVLTSFYKRWFKCSTANRHRFNVHSSFGLDGGVGQKFPNDETNFRIFHGPAYEAMKVFAIRKMKTQFTNKNTHILRTDILQKHQQCRRKLFLIGGLRTRAKGQRKFLNLESLKICHFLDFGKVLTEFWWSAF